MTAMTSRSEEAEEVVTIAAKAILARGYGELFTWERAPMSLRTSCIEDARAALRAVWPRLKAMTSGEKK
jgi:hypothetical protein